MDSLKVDWAVTVPPSVEPISLSDMTRYLRVYFADNNPIVSAWISAYRKEAEIKTGRSFAPQTLQAMWTLPQVNAGSLTGPRLLYEQDFYQYNESLGANPFSPAPFILSMPQPPL